MHHLKCTYWGSLVQVGNGRELEAVGLQFEPYQWAVAPLWCDLGFIPNSRGNKACQTLGAALRNSLGWSEHKAFPSLLQSLAAPPYAYSCSVHSSAAFLVAVEFEEPFGGDCTGLRMYMIGIIVIHCRFVTLRDLVVLGQTASFCYTCYMFKFSSSYSSSISAIKFSIFHY